MLHNINFNKLTAITSKIYNLQVGDISKIQEEQSLSTDSPFQVSDIIVS